MQFQQTAVEGAYIIDPDRLVDSRGFFARVWCAEEFRANGLADSLTQCSISFSERPLTLRGLHYQVPPHQEAKLVRCTMGRIHDVVLDIRPRSPTYLAWFGVELAATSRRMVYIPPGCAHGLLTLEANSEVLYQMAGSFAPACARGVRWNDPRFGISWPAEPAVIADRDRNYPDFTD